MKLLRYNVLQKRGNHFGAAHLKKCDANYAQLTPLSAFKRAVRLFPTQPAYTYDGSSVSWGEMGKRVSKFSSAISKWGLQRGDVVSIIAANSPPMLEAHFALPGSQTVIHPLNTRLDAAAIAYQLQHSESKLVFVDSEYNKLLLDAKAILTKSNAKIPVFINIRDTTYEKENPVNKANLIGSVDYEDFIAAGDENFELLHCVDERDPISLCYTSGTTGNPKGVVCNHRGAYLNGISNIVEYQMERFAGLLSIVPMFHVNAWMFPYSLANLAGCNHLLRNVRAAEIFDIVNKYKIGHITGAPITMTTMLAYEQRARFTHPVNFWTAGSPPPPSVIQRITAELGMRVTTIYGLTEVYGAVTSHIPDPEYSPQLSADARVAQCTRQAHDALFEEVRVLDPHTLQEVPADGVTLGEVMLRGNIVMSGYYKNPSATEEAFAGGWFHSGDIAVNHGRGWFEIKDRSKDIIISGGENISSIEVQDILMTHPGVMEVAVVAMPHEKWGEVPCAFVARDPAAAHAVTEAELIAWARTKMAAFMAPKRVIFGDLPKNATGKVQKNLLRNQLQQP